MKSLTFKLCLILIEAGRKDFVKSKIEIFKNMNKLSLTEYNDLISLTEEA